MYVCMYTDINEFLSTSGTVVWIGPVGVLELNCFCSTLLIDINDSPIIHQLH